MSTLKKDYETYLYFEYSLGAGRRKPGLDRFTVEVEDMGNDCMYI